MTFLQKVIDPCYFVSSLSVLAKNRNIFLFFGIREIPSVLPSVRFKPFPLGEFVRANREKSECDWLVMTSVFVASQSVLFYFYFIYTIRQVAFSLFARTNSPSGKPASEGFRMGFGDTIVRASGFHI